MSIIALPAAKEHLRLGPDYPDEQVETYLLAAEMRAVNFLNRALFADEAAKAASLSVVPARLSEIANAYREALDDAALIDDATARSMRIELAEADYAMSIEAVRETNAGIVATDDIKAAILLILGHLFENRADTEANAPTAIPNGSEYLLMPYRIGWGG